jgi:hypothetical protein
MLAVVFASLAAASVEAGTVFTHNFDMRGDYNQYLDSAINAIVNTEGAFPDVTYWAPSQANVWAEITYRYDLPFQVDTASIYANIHSFPQFDSGARAFLDVSADGTSWTTVESVYVENRNPIPIDISAILSGSTTAFVRARLLESSSGGTIHLAQFLRTTNDPQLQSPNVYQFQATAVVPEPASLICWAVGSVMAGG